MTNVIGIPMILIAVLIFALLFTVISKTLQQRPLLGGNADVVLSLCVAALCVISVFRVTPVPTAPSSQDPVAATALEDTAKEKSDRPLIEFILLPYAALLLTLPFVWLLKLFAPPKQSSDKQKTKIVSSDDVFSTLKNIKNQRAKNLKPHDRTQN